jgi:hypothetical protein
VKTVTDDPVASVMRNEIATKRDQGTVRFTRPLREDGTFPKYGGRGDPNKAESFACAAN